MALTTKLPTECESGAGGIVRKFCLQHNDGEYFKVPRSRTSLQIMPQRQHHGDRGRDAYLSGNFDPE